MALDQTVEELQKEAIRLSREPATIDESLDKFDQAINFLQTKTDYNPTHHAEILVDKTYALRGNEDIAEAISSLEKARQLNTRSNGISSIDSYVKGRIAEENAVMKGVYNKPEANDRKENLINALISIDDAISSYHTALFVGNSIRDKTTVRDRLKRSYGVKSVINKNLAEIEEGKPEKEFYQKEAENYALKEIEMREADGDRGATIQNAYHTLACTYVNSGRYQEAEEFLHKAKESGDSSTEETDTFLNYRLAVNSFKINGEISNSVTDKYIENLSQGKQLRNSLVKFTQGTPGWNSLDEMASEELLPKVKEFYSKLGE